MRLHGITVSFVTNWLMRGGVIPPSLPVCGQFSHLVGLQIVLLLLFATISFPVDSAETITSKPQPPVEACTSCHDDTEARVYTAYHGDCLSCHTDAEPHRRESDSIFPGKVREKACLSCHMAGRGHSKDASRMNFAVSEHSKAGIQCVDCHGIHKDKIGSHSNVADVRMDKSARLCITCHQDVFLRFNMISHHPLREGAITCADCHDQHNSIKTTLGGKTEQCTKCHQAVRGPHVFEHPPAVENCANCHNPHGAPNRRLLEVSQPMLCLQCHSLPNNRHGQSGSSSTDELTTSIISGSVLRNCGSCHAAVHGSSVDQHLRH